MRICEVENCKKSRQGKQTNGCLSDAVESRILLEELYGVK